MDYAFAYLAFLVIAFSLWFAIPRTTLAVVIFIGADHFEWINSESNGPFVNIWIVLCVSFCLYGLVMDLEDLRHRSEKIKHFVDYF